MFLDMTVRTQPIALRALSGPTRHPPHRNNKKSMKARAVIFPLNPCTSLATMRRGRRLSTNSILSCEVSWPKLPEDDGHAEPSSTRRIRPTISRIFRRARCVDDSVTLRHRCYERPTSTIGERFAATNQSRACCAAFSYWHQRKACKINGCGDVIASFARSMRRAVVRLIAMQHAI